MNFDIKKLSNEALLAAFENAVCDINYNPTSEDYNQSGYSYNELKQEILNRLLQVSKK